MFQFLDITHCYTDSFAHFIDFPRIKNKINKNFNSHFLTDIHIIHTHRVSYKFGIVAMLSGLIGVPFGSYLAQRLRPSNPRCDPQICAWGLFISAPMVYVAIVLASISTTWCYIFVFFAELSLNLCWSIVADILLVSV